MRTYPGADCDSDHVPVAAEIRVKLKKMNKPKYKAAKEIRELRRNSEVRERFFVEVHNKYEILRDQCIEEREEPEQLWEMLSTALQEASQNVLPDKRKRRKGNKWITDEIFDLMDERRKAKNSNERRTFGVVHILCQLGEGVM